MERRPRTTPSAHAKRVLVLTDPGTRQRAEFWAELLDEIQRRLPTTRRVHRLSHGKTTDRSLDPVRYDVIVLNWDVINGDPMFGADAALRSVRARREALLSWVVQGGVLIVEGQARHHVPDPEAYAALTGNDDLQVCGWADERDPRQQASRVGERCVMTRAASRSPLFSHLHDIQLVGQPRRFEDLFRGDAQRAMAPDFEDADWGLLYRGWFRRRPPFRRKLAWVTLARTADRPWLRNYPTLMCTTYGSGAIFATTLMLSSTRQRALVTALLRSHGNTHELPVPTLSRFFREHLGALTGIAAAILAAALAGVVSSDQSAPVIAAIAAPLAIGGLSWLALIVRSMWRAAWGR